MAPFTQNLPFDLALPSLAQVEKAPRLCCPEQLAAQTA